MNGHPILVTGSAGFIGFNLSQRLLNEGHTVVGYDNLCPYYDPQLKLDRNAILQKTGRYSFVQGNVEDKAAITELFKKYPFSTVYHLAAQAGVRYSLEHPEVYIKSNIDGTLNILEACRHSPLKPQLLFASSSSVYGLSTRLPFNEADPADHPVALYGATKRANELMGHSYSHLFGLNITALRFFTVYGPWGRPDMALFLFTKNILAGKPIDVFNQGDMIRDFTYVADIVQGIISLTHARKKEGAPKYDVFNIGGGKPHKLNEFIEAIELSLGKKAQRNEMPFQPGDIYETFADTSKLEKTTGFIPQTPLATGIQEFVSWYRGYFEK